MVCYVKYIIADEQDPIYQDLSIDNLQRQYDFLRSIINAAVALQRPMVSTAIISALNAHAISCLHVNTLEAVGESGGSGC